MMTKLRHTYDNLTTMLIYKKMLWWSEDKLMTKFMIILKSQLCCLTTKIRNKMCIGWQRITLLHAVSKQNILYLYFLFLIKKL